MSKAVLFVLILFHCSPLWSQYYFYNSRYYDAPLTVELGPSAGAMNCLTDLGGRHERGRRFFSDVNWRFTHPCGGLFAGVNYNNAVGISVGFTVGQVSACDSILKRYTSATNGRYMRNLSFRSDIMEVTSIAELYPVGFFPDIGSSFMPYLAAGIGLFSFYPQTKWHNSWVGLPVLHTEGEGWKEYPGRPVYKLTQVNVPLGAGIRYEPGPRCSIRCELIYRLLFTDYLDDVSTSYVQPALFDGYLSPQLAALAEKLADRRRGLHQYTNQGQEIRGNSHHNDAFFSVSLGCNYVMGRNRIK